MLNNYFQNKKHHFFNSVNPVNSVNHGSDKQPPNPIHLLAAVLPLARRWLLGGYLRQTFGGNKAWQGL
jgi:hypothetical protein